MNAWGAKTASLRRGRGLAGWLMTKKEFADFELHLEFGYPRWATAGSLSQPMSGDPAFAGMEIQILDDAGYRMNGPRPRATQLTARSMTGATVKDSGKWPG